MSREHRSVIWKLKKEFLEKIVLEATSYKEILDKLGLRSAGGNYQTLKERLSYEEISCDHIPRTSKGRKFNGSRSPINKEELFSVDSPHCRGIVKNRIIRDNLISYKCKLCGLDNTWNGLKIVLVLDHINGVHNDHRLENLRFLCPNCNSQQDTFAGRNQKAVKKMNYCTDCGKIISPANKRCSTCRDIYIKSVPSPKRTEYRNKITKEQLLDDILNMPLTHVGKKYSVSDNAIRKWCVSFGLPCYTKEIQALKESISK